MKKRVLSMLLCAGLVATMLAGCGSKAGSDGDAAETSDMDYVKEKGMLTYEDAVRKMTSLPAKRLGIADERGTLKEGYYADIVIFDPETIADKATYADPKQYTVGIDTVIVNGQISMRDGKQIDEVHAGRMLRRKDK